MYILQTIIMLNHFGNVDAFEAAMCSCTHYTFANTNHLLLHNECRIGAKVKTVTVCHCKVGKEQHGRTVDAASRAPRKAPCIQCQLQEKREARLRKSAAMAGHSETSYLQTVTCKATRRVAASEVEWLQQSETYAPWFIPAKNHMTKHGGHKQSKPNKPNMQ